MPTQPTSTLPAASSASLSDWSAHWSAQRSRYHAYCAAHPISEDDEDEDTSDLPITA